MLAVFAKTKSGTTNRPIFTYLVGLRLYFRIFLKTITRKYKKVVYYEAVRNAKNRKISKAVGLLIFFYVAFLNVSVNVTANEFVATKQVDLRFFRNMV